MNHKPSQAKNTYTQMAYSGEESLFLHHYLHFQVFFSQAVTGMKGF